jgi:hypothetical protein
MTVLGPLLDKKYYPQITQITQISKKLKTINSDVKYPFDFLNALQCHKDRMALLE